MKLFLLCFLFITATLCDFTTTKVGSTLTRWNEFISTLTTVVDGYRVVHSSGGAAGGCVSEGQGYGVFFGAATATAIGSSHASFPTVVSQTVEIFYGWKKMCSLSSGSASCQQGLCSGYPCLPHWKFDDSIRSAQGTGSAPDGDEDAILGMILLVSLTDSNKGAYSWWNEMATWAFQSCKEFMDTTVAVKGNEYMLKLGSCWGGWDCNNPSYHSPGSYRAMKNFLIKYQSVLNKNSEGDQYAAKYEKLISTSYKLLNAAQCSSTGLIPNWYVPKSDPAETGSTACGGSGTPSDQFGAEASRTTWRVALDYIVFGSSESATYLSKVAKHVASKYSAGSWGSLSTGCLVNSVFSGWTDNAFIFAPTFTAFVYPEPSLSNQQAIIDAAGSKISSQSISSYYSGSWTAISTLTLNGDLAKAKSYLGSGSPSNPVPSNPVPSNPVPSNPVPSNPVPSNPVPVSPVPSNPVPSNPVPVSPVPSTECSYAHDDDYWVEINADDDSTVSVTCGDGRKIDCVPNWGKYQCDPKSVKCPSPRTATIDGKCCDLGKGCSSGAENEVDTTTVDSVWVHVDDSETGSVDWVDSVDSETGSVDYVSVNAAQQDQTAQGQSGNGLSEDEILAIVVGIIGFTVIVVLIVVIVKLRKY